MGELVARSDVRGHAIRLALAWSGPAAQARSLRVVRRRGEYPTSAADGLVVLDLADLFTGGAPWGRIERSRFLLLEARAEAGILQAELVEYYANARDRQPRRIVVRTYSGADDDLATTVLEPVARVTRRTRSTARFGAIHTTTIYTRAAGGAVTRAGTLVVSTQGASPSRFDWTAAGAPRTSVPFVRQEVHGTSSSVSAPGSSFHASFVTTIGSQTIRTVGFTEALNPDTGDVERTIAVVDQEPSRRAAEGLDPGLDPGVTYYYTAFANAGMGAPRWTAFAVATGRHGFAEKLYALLPAVHRYYDDPASGPPPGAAQPGSWQLRRFLQVVGPALDQARSLGEGLQALHDVFEVRADYLPHLARWIGWELGRTLPTQRQRTDILYAPEVFASVGAVPNIEALVHRSTAWGCQAKEFVHNVFRTNAPEGIRLWEIWQVPDAAGVLASPAAAARVTRAVNDSIDARPAAAIDPAGAPAWLFWHATRPDMMKSPPSTRRQLWMAPLDGAGAPRPVMQGAPDDGPDLPFSDEWPAALPDGPVIRLFWASSRGGGSGIWTRTLAAGAPGDATRLTSHPAGDHHPAVVKDAGGALWLFWESSRRGPTDIWAMTLAQGDVTWSPPRRITTGSPRDGMPAAVVDAAGQLRLFWSADLGDRTRIFQSILNGDAWSPPEDVSSGGDAALFRDEAPAAALFDGDVWLFWSSNRDGRWRIWASRQSVRTPVPATAPPSEEKEPAAFVDAAGTLRLLFRTQRGGEVLRSRTVDFSDLGAIKRGQVDDRWHYTYSVATDPASLYARDTVGLYITPDDNTNRAPYQAEADRVRTLVEPFRPLHVRFVWFVQPPKVTEFVYGAVDIGESYTDVYPEVEQLGAIGESTSVSLPGWSVLQTNSPTDVSADPADPTTLRRRSFFPAPE